MKWVQANCCSSITLRICILTFCFVSLFPRRLQASEPCVSLQNSPFEICMNAGYETTLPFPKYVTNATKREMATELIDTIKAAENCSAKGLAEAVECAFVAPKCSSKGDPIYPCKQVCAEFLKQCEFHLDEFSLDYLIASCLVFSNGSSGCAPCLVPTNFTTNESLPGPLDRGCQELIIPACKNLELYNYTLSSIQVQEDLYHWMYEKDYTDENPEIEFPAFLQEKLDKYPKCQENIKKLFCGEHFPPCFPDEGPRLYSLCEPLCDQIARDCPEFFSHDLSGAEYCGTMAKGKSTHGFCQSTQWPEVYSWVQYAEPTKTSPPTALASVESTETRGIKVWAIIVTVLMSILLVGIVVWAAFFRRMRRMHTPPYSKQYIRQPLDAEPLETDT